MSIMIDPLIGMPGTPELLVILVIVILVFGASKLPELARSSGQALRIFKDETKDLRDKDDKDAKKSPEQLEIERRDEAQGSTGEVLRERRDDTTA